MSAFKFLLWPIAILYGVIIKIRNFLFNKNIKKSFAFDLPVIGIGNLSVGGSGKTPLTIWILDFLISHNYTPAMLSRGYGRRTSGFRMLSPDSESHSCGDEPVMVYRHFDGKIAVGVAEKRIIGLPLMLNFAPNINAFVLDDIFQHRHLRPSLNILLSEWSNPFWKDNLLPVGRLREPISAAKRASGLIITKTPLGIDTQQLQDFRSEAMLYLKPGTPVFFSYLSATAPKPVFTHAIEPTFDSEKPVFLFSGIAKADYFSKQAADFCKKIYAHQIFKDHHEYAKNDVQQIIHRAKSKSLSDKPYFEKIQFLCTQKDALKINRPEFQELFADYNVFYLPVVHCFYEPSQTQDFADWLKSDLEKFLMNKSESSE